MPRVVDSGALAADAEPLGKDREMAARRTRSVQATEIYRLRLHLALTAGLESASGIFRGSGADLTPALFLKLRM